ncbi:MAG: phosphoglucomutase/phosphomannomutase family protein [Elusimicrobia bacterium]|nr:phosphoglucomutase/phosphomannomutase family protein [Candidatus Liberimonas magnetica]
MIKFGTSGWRGIIADDFTFANVRLVTQSICEYIKSNKSKDNIRPAVIIGYDTRFLSENFAKASAQVLAGNGLKALLCKRDTPTPVLAFEIIRQGLSGGINFTASHNPYQYNGLKFSPSWGGPALPHTTKAIEEKCNTLTIDDIKETDPVLAKKQGLYKEIDPKALYLKRLKELVDFKAIKRANLKVLTDVLYGTGIGYLDEALDEAGVKQKVFHNKRDVLFGGGAPEPNVKNLEYLFDVMKKESCHLGLATDGDGDRFGILDSNGSFINPNQAISLLLYHLVRSRKWKGVVARSVMTTHLIDKIAGYFGLEVKETPVGFKYIGEVMVNNPEDFIIGGEESGGLTIRSHIPEKDGILACLLASEMVSMSKKPLKKTMDEIFKLVGSTYSDRVNFHLSFEEIENFKMRLTKKLPDKISGIKVKCVVTLDGYKFILEDGSWLGMRFSGTEPVVRLYIEADSIAKLKKLTAGGKKFIRPEIGNANCKISISK